MRYVVVEPRAAQETIKRLRAAGTLEAGVKVVREEGSVMVPLRVDATEVQLEGLRIIERKEIDLSAPRARTYRDLVDLPDEVKRELPRAFDVVGDVAVIRLDAEQLPHASAIARALIEWNPAIKRVALDKGVEGEWRVRAVTTLIGSDLVTEHRENGLRFRLDLAKVYFSPRLSGARAEVASRVRVGERVLDMFAGVGPFAVLVAKRHPDADVVAVDSNPDAVAYLGENKRLNKVDLTVVSGKIEGVASGLGRFDRIIMNLPRSAAQFLPLALDLLRPSGGTIHLFSVLAQPEVEPRCQEIERAAVKAGFRAVSKFRQLKTFATRVWVYSFEILVEPAR